MVTSAMAEYSLDTQKVEAYASQCFNGLVAPVAFIFSHCFADKVAPTWWTA